MRLAELSSGARAAVLAIAFVAMGLVLFLLAEGAVRLRAVLKYGYVSGIERRLTVDEATGLRIPIPGSQQGPIVINSLGFRGPEIPVAKAPGTIRIAFLGGSTTYCAEVSSNEATWPDIVTRRLNEEFPGVTFDYVNAGAPGFGVSHLLRNLRGRVAPLKPDVIVIYEATNDLSGNSFNLAREQNVIRERPDQERFWLSDHSLLVRLVELNLKIRQRQQSVDAPAGKLHFDRERLEAPFRENLRELVRESKRVAPVVAVARFSVQYRREQPVEAQVKAAESSLYYMPYMTLDALLDGFDAYNDVITRTAAEEQVLLVGGENDIPGDAVHFNDSVHFTDAGSAAMAERVFAVLREAPGVRALVSARAAGVRPESAAAADGSGSRAGSL